MNKTFDVTPTAALVLIEKGALLVDVREPHEVAKKSFDVPGVMLIPLREFENRYKEIPAERQVIIACNLGNRSLMATRFLINHGYSKAVNMQRGIVCWENEGLPIKKAEKEKNGSWLLQQFRGKS